jgi:hypothetical protein
VQINHEWAGRVMLLTMVLVGGNAARSHAQPPIGYVTAAPAVPIHIGNRTFAWRFGGGGEMRTGPFGVGGSLDYVYFPPYDHTSGRDSWSAPSYSTVIVSATGSFYPRKRFAERAQPFVNGGLAFLLADDDVFYVLPTPQFGGGVDWWLGRRTGLRFEGRMEFTMMVFRFGVVFR